MNKTSIFLILPLIFLGGIFGVISTASAQCPPGWNYVSVSIGPDSAGCMWKVDFCYACNLVGGPSPSTLKVITIAPLNNCWSPDKNWMVEKLRSLYASYCTIPPCDETCLELIVEYPLCAQWYSRGWKDYQNIYHYSNWLQTCSYDGGYCQIVTKVCADGANRTIVCPETLPVYTAFGLACQSSPIPDPGRPAIDFEGEQIISPCFQNISCP